LGYWRILLIKPRSVDCSNLSSQAEKVELETTVVDEMQSQSGGGGLHGLKKYYGIRYLSFSFPLSLCSSTTLFGLPFLEIGAHANCLTGIGSGRERDSLKYIL
jgi:hypothetical protein